MKRITYKVDPSDKIICCIKNNMHEFYYQARDGKEKIYLFSTKYSKSVSQFFGGFGDKLTVRQLYSYRSFFNVRLTKTLERIPTMIDYVIKYQIALDDTYDKVC